MPSKNFVLNDQNDKLTLNYGIYFSNIRVSVNGEEIGTIPNRAALKRGQEFILSNGSKLYLKLYSEWYSRKSELHILLDGKPVKGSMADPYMQVRRIFMFMLLIGGISVVSGLSQLGLSAALQDFDVDQTHNIKFEGMHSFALVNLCIGSGFVILAFFTKRLSVNAVYAAMVLLLISISLRMYISFQIGQGLASFGLIIRVLYIRIMWRGAEAIKSIKAEEEPSYLKIVE